MTQNPSPPISPDEFVGEDAGVVHHESIRAKRGLKDGNMNLNLTSMIDVIFLLLIYFVITANFAVGEGVIIAKLPRGSGPVTEDVFKPIVQKLKVYIHSAGGDGTGYKIEVDGAGDIPDFKQLGIVLSVMQRNEGNRDGIFKATDPVLITPDGTVKWQHVVQGFNAALAAKFGDVRFAEAPRN